MKSILIVFVYSMFILATNADDSITKHSNKTNICMQCMCLALQPYTVDCMNSRYEVLPPLTMNLTYPWQLQLTNNKIIHISQFPVLLNLIKLDLGRNGIKNIDKAAFANLHDLKGLDLSHNNLSAEILKNHVFQGQGLGMLQPLGLEELDLSYNNLHSLESHSLQYLNNLTKLHMNNNPIHDIPYDMATSLSILENLEELDLSHCYLSRLPQHFLTDLRNLRNLNLAGNKFSIVPAEVKYARSLTYLNLNANPISTIMKGDFKALHNIQELELSSMPVLRSVGPEAFTSLDNLAVLKMCDNPMLRSISTYAFTFFDLTRQLKEIYLQTNALTTLSEDMLPWKTLKVVDLQNNPWSCDCKLRWLAEDLIPVLERKNPSKTLSLMCANPVTDRGKKLTNIVGKPNTFSCDPPPYIPEYTIYSPVAIAIIAVGITLMVTSAIIFAYVLYRRTKVRSLLGESVRYRRAHNIDEDGYDEIVET